MKNSIRRMLRIGLLTSIFLLLSSCEPPQVYGSIGYSSYNGGYGGYHGSGGMGGSVRIGGRIY